MAPPVRIRGILFLVLIAMLAAAGSAASNVQIYVHPGSGTVCLDNTCQVSRGTLSGYSSTQFADVSCGQDHRIRVYDTAGYEDTTDSVYVAYNCDPVTRRIYLEPVATPAPGQSTGDIQVFISPGTGVVCRDDKDCEVSEGEPVDTWSVRFSDVTANEPHTITATADGFVTAMEQVSVVPGSISTVNLRLEPEKVAETGAAAEPPSPAPSPAPLDGMVALCAAGAAMAFLASSRCR